MDEEGRTEEGCSRQRDQHIQKSKDETSKGRKRKKGKGKKLSMVRSFRDMYVCVCVCVLVESKTEVKAGRQEVMGSFKISGDEYKSKVGTFMRWSPLALLKG